MGMTLARAIDVANAIEVEEERIAAAAARDPQQEGVIVAVPAHQEDQEGACAAAPAHAAANPCAPPAAGREQRVDTLQRARLETEVARRTGLPKADVSWVLDIADTLVGRHLSTPGAVVHLGSVKLTSVAVEEGRTARVEVLANDRHVHRRCISPKVILKAAPRTKMLTFILKRRLRNEATRRADLIQERANAAAVGDAPMPALQNGELALGDADSSGTDSD